MPSSSRVLRQLLFDILDISPKIYEDIVKSDNPDLLRKIVISKSTGFTIDEINEICNILTLEG